MFPAIFLPETLLIIAIAAKSTSLVFFFAIITLLRVAHSPFLRVQYVLRAVQYAELDWINFKSLIVEALNVHAIHCTNLVMSYKVTCLQSGP